MPLIELFVAERPDGPAAEQTGSRRLPSRRAQVHTGKCVDCERHQLRGPDGWVALSAASAGMIECDAEVVDDQGKIVRTITERVRRLVFERDGMACAVPNCGATRGLHLHHEAPDGWRGVGEDPENILVLCGPHHRQRHEGWLTIQGSASTGFRFYRHGGGELVARKTAVPPGTTSTQASTTAAAAPMGGAHTGNPEPAEVDAVAEAALRTLEFPRTAARAAVQRVRAQAGPLTVEELVTLVLRGLPAGRAELPPSHDGRLLSCARDAPRSPGRAPSRCSFGARRLRTATRLLRRAAPPLGARSERGAPDGNAPPSAGCASSRCSFEARRPGRQRPSFGGLRLLSVLVRSAAPRTATPLLRRTRARPEPSARTPGQLREKDLRARTSCYPSSIPARCVPNHFDLRTS